MKRSSVKEIFHYLFRGLPQPFEVLGQDNCRKIEIYQGKYLKVIGGSKEIFLKNLSEALFIEVSNSTKEIRYLSMTIPKSVCAMIEGTVYSWRLGIF
jgi:hypothetical protein